MNSRKNLEQAVLMAAREQGISSVLFRNTMGKRLGLNIADWECLSLLGIKGISTPTELARYTGLATGSATAMLDRLERAGFIRRRANPEDRRGVLIEVDARWQQAAGPLVAGVQKAHRDLIAGYSARELEVIADFLTRFTENVRAQTKAIEQGE
jgi:DNA-binding MarR family transcriptional regulator